MLADQDVESILTGHAPADHDLAELITLVNSLRSYRTNATSTVWEQRAFEAGVIVRSSRSQNSDLQIKRRRQVGPQLRVATAAAAFAIVFGISGMAVAANGSAPGDPLHGIDMFFEKFGIGSGGEGERIAEADTLIESGDPDAAFVLLGEYLEQLDTEGNTEAIEKVERHIELASTKSNTNAAAAQEKVALMKAFIELNKGDGVGLDGKEFGQGVSEIAKSKPKPNKPSLPETAGPKNKKND